MRAAAVRAAVVATMEAIVPDVQATGADVFRYVPDDVAEDDRDRAFGLSSESLSTLANINTWPSDFYDLTLELRVRWLGTTDAAELRMLADGEKILVALQGLEASGTYPQIMRIDITDGRVDRDGGGAVGVYRIQVTYDPRS